MSDSIRFYSTKISPEASLAEVATLWEVFLDRPDTLLLTGGAP